MSMNIPIIYVSVVVKNWTKLRSKLSVIKIEYTYIWVLFKIFLRRFFCMHLYSTKCRKKYSNQVIYSKTCKICEYILRANRESHSIAETLSLWRNNVFASEIARVRSIALRFYNAGKSDRSGTDGPTMSVPVARETLCQAVERILIITRARYRPPRTPTTARCSKTSDQRRSRVRPRNSTGQPSEISGLVLVKRVPMREQPREFDLRKPRRPVTRS